MSDLSTTGQVTLSKNAVDALLSALRSAPGAHVHRTEPATDRELLDNGLINSHFVLTRRGARQREILEQIGER